MLSLSAGFQFEPNKIICILGEASFDEAAENDLRPAVVISKK